MGESHLFENEEMLQKVRAWHAKDRLAGIGRLFNWKNATGSIFVFGLILFISQKFTSTDKSGYDTKLAQAIPQTQLVSPEVIPPPYQTIPLPPVEDGDHYLSSDKVQGTTSDGTDMVEVVPSNRTISKNDASRSQEVPIDRDPKIKKTSCEAIEYPRQRFWNEETGTGTTALEILVSESGAPINVVIATSSGYRRLDQAAKNNVMTCEFEVAIKNGAPYAAWTKVEYVWRQE